MAKDRLCIFEGVNSPLSVINNEALLSPDQALVRTEACTLCSSDLHTVTGRRISPAPSVLGHEAIGHVEQLPQGWTLTDVTGHPIKQGQRIVWGVAASCQECLFCRSGIPQKCLKLLKYGHSVHQPGAVPKGGLSERVEIVRGTPVVSLSDTIPAGVACLSACAGATVAAVIRQCGALSGRSVLVMGGGVLGAIACRMAAVSGASLVICVEPDQMRRDRSSRFSANEVIDPQQENALSQIRNLANAGLGIDFALEFSGANAAFRLAMESLRTGGSLILAGAVFPAGPVEIDPEQIVRRMLKIEGMHNYAPMDLHAAVQFIEQDYCNSPAIWNELIGETFSLGDVSLGFDWAIGNPGRRAVISMMLDKGQ